MSVYPPQNPTMPPVPGGYPPQAETNGLGIAGFVVSITGVIVCAGIICPIGLILSLIALTKPPRGFAIAGAIIGLLGTVGGIIMWIMIFSSFSTWMYGSMTSYEMDMASFEIDHHYDTNGDTLPNESDGNVIVSAYTDEWGTALRYREIAGSTTDYEIISAGEDMAFDTADDIVQVYVAYGYSSYGGYGGYHTTDAEDEVDPYEINHAYDQGSRTINESFPPDSAMPDEDAGNDALFGQFDPWGTQMRYRPSPDSPGFFHIRMAGPDGVWDTADDELRSFPYAPRGNP